MTGVQIAIQFGRFVRNFIQSAGLTLMLITVLVCLTATVKGALVTGFGQVNTDMLVACQSGVEQELWRVARKGDRKKKPPVELFAGSFNKKEGVGSHQQVWSVLR